MAYHTLMLLLTLGVGVLGAALDKWELAEREKPSSEETVRDERCIGMLGSTRGSIQGIVADNKTPAERLQEFRKRVEAVRSLVVPPGLRRAQSPPSAAIGQSPPGIGIPLLGQSVSTGSGLSVAGQPPFNTGISILGQPSPTGAQAAELGHPATDGQSILGQPSPTLPFIAPIQQTISDVRSALMGPNGAQSSGAGLPILNPIRQTVSDIRSALTSPNGAQHNGPTGQSILGQPDTSGTGLPILTPIQQTIADVRSALTSPNGAQHNGPTGQSILGQPSSADTNLPILSPVQKTIADLRSALMPPNRNGAKTSLPVSPFSKKQVAAGGIMKSTADILGISDEQQGGESESVLGSPHKPDSSESVLGSPHKQDMDVVGNDHEQTSNNQQSTLADLVHSAISPVESSGDQNKLEESPQAVQLQPSDSRFQPYIPKIPAALKIPGLLEPQ